MTGATLVRRGDAHSPRQEYPQGEPAADAVDEQAAPPKSRRVWFDIPEGFMAQISLVPYTESGENPADAELPPADASLIGHV